MKNGLDAQGNWRAHHLQHPGSAHQPGIRAQYPDGRVPSKTWSAFRRALQRLGAEHALVTSYGRDGLDEISLGAGTLVGELQDGVERRA